MTACVRCGIEKDESCFPKSNNRKSGLDNRCRSCENKRRVDYYTRHRSAENARAMDWQRKNRDIHLRRHRILTCSDKQAEYYRLYTASERCKRIRHLNYLVYRELSKIQINPDFHLFPDTKEGKILACKTKVKEIKIALKLQYEAKAAS